jgi:endoglucanase
MLPMNTNPINHIGKGGKNVKDNKYTEFTKEQPLFHVKDVKFPLSTKDMKIVDEKGRRVKLVGTNWSGAHLIRHVVSGLEYRGLRDIALEIRDKFHMNCIRLTYSLQMFFDNNVVDAKYIKANPDLEGKTVMEIFDHTIQVLTEVGLMVILNNHTSSSMWCCSECDGDGLWWSEKYPEKMFF